MNFIKQLKNYVNYKYHFHRDITFTQISKAGLAFFSVSFWVSICLYLSFHHENEQTAHFIFGLIGFFGFLFSGFGLIYFYFYFSFSENHSPSHEKSLLSSVAYFFKFIYWEFIFEPLLEFKLKTHFKEYYNYFSSKNYESYAESFYSSCIDNDISYYDINSMYRIFETIEQAETAEKNKSKHKHKTDYLSLFNKIRFQEGESSLEQPLKFFSDKQNA